MKQLKNYVKTDAEKKKIRDNLNTAAKNGGATANTNIQNAAQRMRDILREEILKIQDKNGVAFLDHINIENSVKTIQSNGQDCLSVGIYFEDDVWSNSLWYSKYEMGAYLPFLFNNNYYAKHYVYGKNNQGAPIRSQKTLPDRHLATVGFMKRAVDRFNSEMSGSGIRAEYSTGYDKGTG